MEVILYDGALFDLGVKSTSYFSGGAIGTLDGGLLAWGLKTTISGRFIIYGSSMTWDIDTIGHTSGASTDLGVNIAKSPTYRLDFDALNNGNLLVSWSEHTINQPDFHSFYRLFDMQGKPVGPKTEFLSPNGKSLGGVAVTALGDGGFVTTWESYRNSSSESYAQIHAADGSDITGAFRLNRNTAGDQQVVGATALGDTGFMAFWTDRQAGGETSLVGRAFSDAGAALTKAFVLSAPVPDHGMVFGGATELANGDIAVVWTTLDMAVGRSQDLYLQVLHPNGKPVVPALNIATAAGSTQDFALSDAGVLALKDGRFLVSWIDGANIGSSFTQTAHALARIYNADGSLSVDTFDLAQGRADVNALKVTLLADGRIAAHVDLGLIPDHPLPSVQIIDPRLAAVSLTGTTFADQLQGTAFGDTILGGNGDDKLSGMVGNDLLGGDTGADTLLGGDGNDTLLGGLRDDSLVGGLGNDKLTGGTGNDAMTGGLGADRFVFAGGDGQDRISDFRTGQDLLDLHSFGFASATQALSNLTQTPDGALFTFGTDTILLMGVQASTISAASLIL